MRLIDADALMKDLEKWLKQVDPTHPQEDNAIPPMEDIIVSTLMTIEEQPTIEPEPHWIKCSERLPDKGLRVLMCLNNAWQIVGWYDKEDKQWYALPYEEPIEEFTYAKVIAWMPLPKYEEED